MTNVIGEITEGAIAVIWGGGVWRPLPGVLHLRSDFTKLLSCGANRAIPYILIMLIEQLQMKIRFQPKPILPFKIAPSSSSTHTHTFFFNHVKNMLFSWSISLQTRLWREILRGLRQVIQTVQYGWLPSQHHWLQGTAVCRVQQQAVQRLALHLEAIYQSGR